MVQEGRIEQFQMALPLHDRGGTPRDPSYRSGWGEPPDKAKSVRMIMGVIVGSVVLGAAALTMLDGPSQTVAAVFVASLAGGGGQAFGSISLRSPPASFITRRKPASMSSTSCALNRSHSPTPGLSENNRSRW